MNACKTGDQERKAPVCTNVALPLMALRLRFNKTFADLADQVVYLFWNHLTAHGRHPPMDPHRYPDLTRAVQRVLEDHIHACTSPFESVGWDAWARSGGGAPTESQIPPICDQHVERFRQEFGEPFQRAVSHLEEIIKEFIRPGFEAEVRRAVRDWVEPFLIQNLATRYCESCEREGLR